MSDGKCGFVHKILSHIRSLHPVRVYLKDSEIRLHLNLLRSLVFGILYTAFNLFSSLYYKSTWFLSVSVYYLLIILMRYILFRMNRRDEAVKEDKEYRIYRSIGVIMLVLNAAMASMIMYTVLKERRTDHSLLFIIMLGIYSASTLAYNLASIIKHRHKRSGIKFLMSRIISLSAALMSAFNLVNSFIYKTSLSSNWEFALNAVSGTFVIFSVLIMSVSIICRANRRIMKIKLYNSERN